MLPKLDNQAVVLNWSERSQWGWWRKPLEVQVFQHWTGWGKYVTFAVGGVREFNPVAITFIPWWKRRVFRFWQPFRDFKHGKERPLKELEAKLFDTIQ
jgi:hypothetical protein